MNSTSSSSSYVVTPTATDGPCSADFGNLPLPQQPDHPIYILGIEGSANKVAVGIVKYCPQQNTYHIIANPRKTYHAPAGHGFLPKETAWHHQAHIVALVRVALLEAFPTPTTESSATPTNKPPIHAIAFTKGPGMGAPLQSCAIVARMLSLLWNVPLIAVNHCIAHIEMGRVLCKTPHPIVLYVSGGNTQVVAYAHGYYRIFGETIDIAVGNCLDRVARLLHLPNDPSPGYHVEQQAALASFEKSKDTTTNNNGGGNSAPATTRWLELPHVIKGMDVSFSGILTQVQEIVEKDKKGSTSNGCSTRSSSKSPKGDTNKQTPWTVPEICAAVQETIFSMLVEITERAMAHTGSTDVLLVGGVGCNRRLQQMMQIMVSERQRYNRSTTTNDMEEEGELKQHGRVGDMDHRYCVDNGAMIAQAGMLVYQYHPATATNNKMSDSDAVVITPMEDTWCTQRFRTDQVPVTWRK